MQRLSPHAHPFPPLGAQVQGAKKKTGVIAPKRFVQRLKRDNEAFRSYMHQVQGTPCSTPCGAHGCA